MNPYLHVLIYSLIHFFFQRLIPARYRGDVFKHTLEIGLMANKVLDFETDLRWSVSIHLLGIGRTRNQTQLMK